MFSGADSVKSVKLVEFLVRSTPRKTHRENTQQGFSLKGTGIKHWEENSQNQ